MESNLNDEVARGKIDPVIGREAEIKRVIEIISRRTKNNPVLIGEPGVGQFESRIQSLLKKIKESDGNAILFIDEVHQLVGMGRNSGGGAMDAANILKPMMARGEIKVIGATTLNEYREYIEKDAALERRMQKIIVNEPNKQEALTIMRGLKEKWELFHGVKISDAALVAAVSLADRYVSDKFLPDKAIDLVDEACAKIKEEIEDSKNKLERLQAEGAYEKASLLLYVTIPQLENKLKSREERVKDNEYAMLKDSVTEEEIAEVLSKATSIPVRKLLQGDKNKLSSIRDELHASVKGQNEAIETVASAVLRGRAGINDPNRPIGSFLFMGPTGVGKTEVAKTLARVLFDSEKAMVRVDMSEYMEKSSISKLIGAPPGYVGYESAGQLTEQVRRKPYSIVLFDEIDKAHPDVLNILLQVLDDGVLTDSQGRKVNFKNTIIIMTSNLGAQLILDRKKDQASELLASTLRPEFLNRIDEIVVFNALNEGVLIQIVNKLFEELTHRLGHQEIFVEFREEVKERIRRNGYDPQYGARPFKRYIQKHVENLLAERIITGELEKDKRYSMFINAQGDLDLSLAAKN
ncbi:unnamed protein product [Didymodactylos carnosus]|uniref:Clp protease ATP binding subunit n=1 Tax=Didymodactylos carnosus TaxID=1234261 RepID=A0A8S2CX22_9BILA|nr:unnamed protein product [Didymodactylos carnosus]CAF3609397.1 unnamed protein product [Didymodactylos carnosus]